MSTNRKQSLREMGQHSTPPTETGNTLSPGVRNFLMIVLGWSCLSHLGIATGIWDYEGKSSTFDVIMTTINVLAPMIGMVFIGILYDLQNR